MPTPVYHFSIQGRDVNANKAFASKEEAQALYDKIVANLTNDFVELNVDESVATIRVANISGFSVRVTLEETPEERKQREIARIQAGGDTYYNEPKCAAGIGYGGILG